jgi:hypothetical protein
MKITDIILEAAPAAPTQQPQKKEQVLPEDRDPCWANYKQVGMKTKNGKKVPNCVPKESVKEMDGDGAGRDGSNRKKHSTYGSRDRDTVSNGPDIHLGPKNMMKRKDVLKHAASVLNKSTKASRK